MNLKKLYGGLYGVIYGGRLVFTIAIDVTKVSQVKPISHKYKSIVGGSYPNHFISFDELYDD